MSLFSKDCEEVTARMLNLTVSINTQTSKTNICGYPDKSFNYYLPKTERALRQAHSDEAALRICFYFKRKPCLETFRKHDKQCKNWRKL